MLFGQCLDQLRAAGEETRLRMLALLARGDLTVSELTRILDQLQPRVSRHLRILVDAGLITPYQEGAWRFYRLADLPEWLEACLDNLEGEEIAADLAALDEVRANRARRAAAFFAENAESWDALRKLHTDDGEIERALLDLAPRKIDRFIDLGTGTGRMLVVFKDRYRDAVGYDLSPEMLAVARVRLEEVQVQNARVRRLDILDPDDIPAASADLVCLHHVLHFLGEPERAVAVAASVLRPGGILLIADFASHDLEELRERYAHRRLGFDSGDIHTFAEHAGLRLERETTLQPGAEGNLVSKIWRLSKPSVESILSRSREEALA